MSVVPAGWRFLFLGSTESLKHVNKSTSIQLQQATGKLELREAPRNGSFSEREHRNRMFTDLSFYDTYLGHAEWLLVFQTDSILCAAANSTLDDWLEYDWVGARGNDNEHYPGGDSGGLSLRRVSRIKEVLKFQSRQDDGEGEDRWLVRRVGLLPGAKMAENHVEQQFSVERIWYDKPLGYHMGPKDNGLPKEIWDNQAQRRMIYDYCPEIKMILAMKLEGERCKDDASKHKGGERDSRKKHEAQRKKQQEEAIKNGDKEEGKVSAEERKDGEQKGEEKRMEGKEQEGNDKGEKRDDGHGMEEEGKNDEEASEDEDENEKGKREEH